jgi:hypothetical protein
VKVSRVGKPEQLGAERRVCADLLGYLLESHVLIAKAGNQLLGHSGHARKLVRLVEKAFDIHSAFPLNTIYMGAVYAL